MEYYSLTWVEYQKMLSGWERRNSRLWEHTRLIVWTNMAINRDPKKNFPSIKEYMPLPTDTQIDEQSEGARMQKLMDEYKEKVKNRK